VQAATKVQIHEGMRGNIAPGVDSKCAVGVGWVIEFWRL
jgi:hypothetical protein